MKEDSRIALVHYYEEQPLDKWTKIAKKFAGLVLLVDFKIENNKEKFLANEYGAVELP